MTNVIKTGIAEFDSLFGETEGFVGGRMYLIASIPTLRYPEIPLLGLVPGLVMKVDREDSGYLAVETYLDRVRKDIMQCMWSRIDLNHLDTKVNEHKPAILVINASVILRETAKAKLREIRDFAVVHGIPVLIVDHPEANYHHNKWSVLKNLGRGFEVEFDGVFCFDQPEIRVQRTKLRDAEVSGPAFTTFVGFGD